MLTDHGFSVARSAARLRALVVITTLYGRFLASLASWNWFLNPVTFRDSALVIGKRAVVPRSRSYPISNTSVHHTSENQRDFAVAQLTDFLKEVGAASNRVGWVIGEETGDLGRVHFHVLVAGVGDLNRADWQSEAERRFGRARFLEYDSTRPGSAYLAKCIVREPGGLHFGGVLAGVNMSGLGPAPGPPLHGIEIANSAELPATLFHLTLKRRHK